MRSTLHSSFDSKLTGAESLQASSPACPTGEGLAIERFVDKMGSGCNQPLTWHEPSPGEVGAPPCCMRPFVCRAALPAECPCKANACLFMCAACA